MVNYEWLNDWSRPPLDDLSNVRKVKACNLLRHQLDSLLLELPSTLEQLDIDTFEVLQGDVIKLKIDSLLKLAIEEIIVVEPHPTEEGWDAAILGAMAFIRVVAPDLQAVYLGEHLNSSQASLLTRLILSGDRWSSY